MSDINLLGIIQKAVQETVDAQKPADLIIGKVQSVSPLSVKIDALTAPIPQTALLLTSSVKAKTANVIGGEGGHVIINEGLSAGDSVIMLRVQKGQKFVILSKL